MPPALHLIAHFTNSFGVSCSTVPTHMAQGAKEQTKPTQKGAQMLLQKALKLPAAILGIAFIAQNGTLQWVFKFEQQM